MSASEPREPLYTRPFLAATGAHALVATAVMSLPVLCKFFEARLGASPSAVGALMSAGIVAGILLRFAVGWINDHLGRRISILAGGTLLVGSYLAYPAAEDLGPFLVAVRIAQGIGMGALFATVFTIALDIAPPRRRVEAMAVFGAAGMFGTAVGPRLGEWLAAEFSFSTFFAAMAMMTATGATIFSLVAGRRASDPGPTGFLRAIGRALASRSLLAVWVPACGFGVACGGLLSFVGLMAEERALGSMGYFFTPYGATAVGLRLAAGSLPDRIGPSRLIGPAFACYVAGVMGVAAASSTAGLVAGGILCGLGHGYVFPILGARAYERSEAQLAGTTFALFTICVDVGSALGNPAIGAVAEAASYAHAFWGAGLVVALSYLIGRAIDTRLAAPLQSPRRQRELRITIYTRRDCPLCDEARQVVERCCGRGAAEMVDVDLDPELRRLHGDSVPVVMIDGKKRFAGRVNEVLLRRLL